MEELKFYSTMGIGSQAQIHLPQTEEEFLSIISTSPRPIKIVGNGSNILFGECEGIEFISTRKIKKRKRLNENCLIANCSNSLYELYRFCSAHNLGGFERLALIPASLGGAIHNNASCFGQSISDYITKIKIFDGKKVRWIKKENIEFGYHHANIDFIILGAKFILPQISECKLRQDFCFYREKRLSSQPIGKTLGSIFKNPPNLSAGKLIEDCGLKGYQIGDAKISDKHANIFLNLGNASFVEMIKLITHTKNVVKEKTGVLLECEIETVSNKKE